MKEKELRAALVAEARALRESGLDPHGSVDLSGRIGPAMLITPATAAHSEMRPAMVAVMPIDGEYGKWSGRFKPSEEWRLHLDIMRARPDVGAIVHFRPIYATALAMTRKPIPAVDYRIAAFGGPSIRCADYAPYGTKDLAELVVAALQDRHAALIANHGAIATGADLGEAILRAYELETLAKTYSLALAAGRPAILSDDEIMRIVERLKGARAAAPSAPAKGAKKAPRKNASSRKAATKVKSRRRAKKARKA
jgi:L-fuculose-phosphate aldolase